MLMIILSLFGGWVAWRLGFFRVSSKEPWPQGVQGRHVLGVFGVYILFFLLVPLLLSQMHFGDIALRWFSVGSVVGSLAVVVLFMGVLPKEARAAVWSLKGRASRHDFFVGVATVGFAYPCSLALSDAIIIVLQWMGAGEPIDQVAVDFFKIAMSQTSLLAATAFVVVVVAPLVEELLFRGFLLGFLLQKMRFPVANVITCFLFAGLHYSSVQKWSNVAVLVPLFLLSWFLGFLFYRQRSLRAPLGLHMAFNAMNALVIMVTEGVEK